MKPNAQRIAIAEACGWTEISMHCMWGLPPNAEDDGTEDCLKPLPDYLNDLNAMHEAEKVLWKMDWNNRYIFNDELANIMKGRKVNRNEWDAETLLDATAANRAEAFLRTLNL